jgi:hypothetical protein
MKIEIEIPDTIISDAAVRAWKECFHSPQYQNHAGGEGYQRIRDEVKKHLFGPEANEQIIAAVKAVAMALTEPVVRECVTEELRKRVKQIVREERKSQTLFDSEAK